MDEKVITGDSVNTPELLAAEINKAFQKYNNMLSVTATAQQVKEVQAQMIVENKDLLNKISVNGDEMAKLKATLENFNEVVKKQGEAIATMKTYAGESRKQSFSELLYKELENKAFDDIANERVAKTRIQIQTKDIAFTGTYGSGAAGQAVMPFQVPQMPPMENFDVRLILPTGTIDSEKLEYPQERAASLTDSTASKAENAVGVASEFGFTMETANSKRITTFVNISRRALRNTAWLSNYISNRLMALFVKELNREAIAATGSGTDLNGLVNQANTFAGTDFAGTIENANYMDVINCAMGEMESTYDLMPNSILMNPVDHTILTSTKNTIADFINPSTFLSSGNTGYTSMFGLRPIRSKNITKGQYLVAAIDAAYMQLLFNGPIEIIATDSHDTNFIKNLVTLKLEADVMLPIYNANSLLKGTFATDLTTITKL